MILKLDRVLLPEQIDEIHRLLHDGEFVDGKLTAGYYAKTVKQNQQLASGSDVAETARSIVSRALSTHPLFQAAVLPKTIRPILFSRYTPGMEYGWHTDNAIMGAEEFTRSDVALTLFLSEPNSYTGGELEIDSSLGEQSFKLPAGCAIVYPATTLHRVTPVTSGTRLAAVTWVQSLVRDSHDREILFDLDTARRSIFAQHGKTLEFDLLSKIHANLLRK